MQSYLQALQSIVQGYKTNTNRNIGIAPLQQTIKSQEEKAAPFGKRAAGAFKQEKSSLSKTAFS